MNKEVKNCYEILGVNRNSSINDIKVAYRHLVKKYHPDMNKDPEAKERFIEIQKSYEELTNPKIESLFNVFGIEIWEDIIKREDFSDKEFTVNVVFGREESEEYKKYRKYKWAKNKVKLLNKLYRDIGYYKDKINASMIIEHLDRVLNNKIDVKEKIIKPEIITKHQSHYKAILNSYEDGDNYRLQKFQFDIQNQFHPKFLNKLPMRTQIFIHNKIRYLIRQLNMSRKNKID